MSAHVQTITTIIAATTAAGGIAAGAWRAARRGAAKLDAVDDLAAMASDLERVAKLAPALAQVVEDFHGVPDRPGVPGRSGVMPALADLRASVDRLDDGQIELLRRLGNVETQLHPNGGSTMRDEIKAIAQVVTAQSQGLEGQ